jgi:chromosome segregation ATPase
MNAIGSSNKDLSEDPLIESLSNRIKIIEDRLEEIAEEIEERKRIGEAVMRKLEDYKKESMGYLNDEDALRSRVEGKDFYERRANMLKRIEGIDQQINKEMSQLWRDIQDLTEERRELRERRELLLAKRRSAEKVLRELGREGGESESDHRGGGTAWS